MDNIKKTILKVVKTFRLFQAKRDGPQQLSLF